MAVVVIVPVHNGGERFHANMDSIRRAEPPPDEVIVIGDGDTDGSSQFAEAAGITVYRFPTPKGPSRARNLGASKAMSELLLSVDVAGTVPENVIDRVRDLFARDSDVAAMIGSYDDQPGESKFSFSVPEAGALFCSSERSRGGVHVLGYLWCGVRSSWCTVAVPPGSRCFWLRPLSWG